MKTTNSVKALSAIAFGLMLQAASAGNITDINVSVLPNKQRVVKVRFDKDVVEPSGFITATPARIALDFPGTDVNLQQPNLTFNDSLLSQVVAAQGNNHARILLGLSKEGQYNTEIKGNEVWIYVSEASATNTAPAAKNSVARNTQPATYTPTATQQTYGTPNFNVDFHKGANNAGVVTFASGYTGEPQVKRQSDRLVITLKNYALSTQDQRNLDVTDFSTPVRTIAVKRLGNDTQVTIRMQGTWSHKITGNNGNQTITIQPERNVAALGANTKAKTNFSGKTISLDFQNVDVRTILQIIAKEANTNIVASDSVQGKMTLSLKDVPWDQALNLVLDARDLEMKRIGNIINVAPREEMLKKKEANLESIKKIEELGPLLSQTFQLKYKNVEEFKTIMRLDQIGSTNSNGSNSILSDRGSALIDPATNTLIITDNEYVVRKLEKIIEELDVPSRQVMVEARIVEAADGVSRDLGVRFGANGAHRNGQLSWGSDWNNAIQKNSRYVGTDTASFAPNVNLPVTAATSSISIIRSWASGALGLELSALETDNLTKTISTPRVLTQDRKEAEIKQGFQIPYTTRDDDGSTETVFKDAVMSLKVIPRITPDNKIILDIAINKDEPDYTNVNAEGEPGIATKSVKTQAMIEDGGTLVVGGIYQEIMKNNVSKVPVLGDIPVLGNLFKSRSRANTRNELLFFITPRIMGHEASVLRY